MNKNIYKKKRKQRSRPIIYNQAQLAETAATKTGHADASSLRAVLKDIEGQSRRMSDMLTALLNYSSLGRKYEALEQVDTRALILSIADSLPESGITVAVDGDWPSLSTLRAPMDLVLRNLVANALQHHDRQIGQVTVCCSDHPQSLKIAISDDGPGIDPKHHNAIFLPFRTLTAGADTNSTGMGLAAVKKTIEAAGGTVEVSSNPKLRRGTTFLVTWPKVIFS